MGLEASMSGFNRCLNGFNAVLKVFDYLKE